MVVMTISLIASFGAIFIPVYDAMNAYARWRKPLTSYFTEEGRLEGKLNKDVELGTTETPGGLDALTVPCDTYCVTPCMLCSVWESETPPNPCLASNSQVSISRSL